MTRRVLFLAVAMVAIALLAIAAACGGGDDEETGVVVDGNQTATADAGDSPGIGGSDNGGDNEGDGGGEIDACELLTVDEVSSALGEEASEGESEIFDPVFTCTYETESFNSVLVSVFTGPQESVEEYFELGNEDSEVVEDVGDRAYWVPMFNDLEVLVGDYYLAITVSSESDIDALTAAKTLANAAIGRLP